MIVKYVVQIVSNSYLFGDSSETAKFCETFDSFFDSVNIRL